MYSSERIIYLLGHCIGLVLKDSQGRIFSLMGLCKVGLLCYMSVCIDESCYQHSNCTGMP